MPCASFGKGRHAAALSFGDCFSYALSRSTGEPLLCKGEDFPRTDVACCSLT
jgi:ribonuclease VapC